jgi:DNA-binding transcriptional regulator YhcF (GntR family)
MRSVLPARTVAPMVAETVGELETEHLGVEPDGVIHVRHVDGGVSPADHGDNPPDRRIISQDVRSAKIQLWGHFAVNRDRAEPLSVQIVRQLEEAILNGRVTGRTRLPSTRSLARTLGVSRNTVLTAYDELASRGFLRSRRNAGIYVFAPTAPSGFAMRSVMRDAQYPSCTLVTRDQDGNPITIAY